MNSRSSADRRSSRKPPLRVHTLRRIAMEARDGPRIPVRGSRAEQGQRDAPLAKRLLNWFITAVDDIGRTWTFERIQQLLNQRG